MYELSDFGGGRRLERFGEFVIDRPAPAAEAIARDANLRDAWKNATARFELTGDAAAADRGRWIPADTLPKSWVVQFGEIQFELRPTNFGHLGVFPEQAENWRWLRALRAPGYDSVHRLKVLNLFAYTGGSTIAAAAANAEVVHVDSARGPTAAARINARLSGLAAAPIRWIVEDARRFVRRELTRGNRYDAVVLDPPSYGHGPKGQAWKLDRDLPALLVDCMKLLADTPSLVLLSCHTPRVTPPIAARMLTDAAVLAGRIGGHIESGELSLETSSGKRLSCGVSARFFG